MSPPPNDNTPAAEKERAVFEDAEAARRALSPKVEAELPARNSLIFHYNPEGQDFVQINWSDDKAPTDSLDRPFAVNVGRHSQYMYRNETRVFTIRRPWPAKRVIQAIENDPAKTPSQKQASIQFEKAHHTPFRIRLWREESTQHLLKRAFDYAKEIAKDYPNGDYSPGRPPY